MIPAKKARLIIFPRVSSPPSFRSLFGWFACWKPFLEELLEGKEQKYCFGTLHDSIPYSENSELYCAFVEANSLCWLSSLKDSVVYLDDYSISLEEFETDPNHLNQLEKNQSRFH
mmetsp:Transcript_30738/g.64184  ORF Transcript_30738/g.64184 Transcript_30738/m.64184 type:complete len:115 (-) Transcript_30738:961-1305(-)